MLGEASKAKLEGNKTNKLLKLNISSSGIVCIIVHAKIVHQNKCTDQNNFKCVTYIFKHLIGHVVQISMISAKCFPKTIVFEDSTWCLLLVSVYHPVVVNFHCSGKIILHQGYISNGWVGAKQFHDYEKARNVVKLNFKWTVLPGA